MDDRNDCQTGAWVINANSLTRRLDLGGPLLNTYFPTLEVLLRMIPDWEDRFPPQTVEAIKKRLGETITSTKAAKHSSKCSLQ